MAENMDKKTILVVDDDISTRKLIVDALNQAEDYTIREAEDGVKALETLQETHCDLIISDINMPGMDGMELLTRVREINPAIYVIMITGYPTIGLSVSAIKTGAVDFLTKPFDIDDLTYKVDVYLREQAILTEDTIKQKMDSAKLTDKIRELSTHSYIYDSLEKTGESNEYIFQEMVDMAMKVADGESCSVLLYDEESDEYYPQTIKSSTLKSYREKIIPSLKAIFNEVVQKKEALLFSSSDRPEVVSPVICAPLKIRNNVFGILSLSRRRSRVAFTEKDLNYILTLAKRASLNLENNILYESIYANLLDTFKSLIASIQVRDHYTEEHSRRVMNLAVKTAEAMKCSREDIESLKVACMLHDIGKIAIPDDTLLKPGKLTDEEYSVIKNHTVIGENILKPIVILDAERKIIRHHHERWDGRGYPDGLSGHDIPFLSRIISVADSFDAMTNNRPYRNAMDTEEALAELKRNSDTQFDKSIVDSFLDTLKKKR